MTRVDFYILAAETALERSQFACKLAYKTAKLGHKIFILTKDEAQTQLVDDLLWTEPAQGFLPHQVISEQALAIHESTPVVISHLAPSDLWHDLIINLSDARPLNFSQFDRLAEVVVQTEPCLSATRENYRFYRERHYPLHQHDLRQKVI